MKFRKIILFFFLLSLSKTSSAEETTIYVQYENHLDSIVVSENKSVKYPKFLLRLIEKKQEKEKSKHLTAAALAFPFPFGIVGLHRIYLGCAPYVPVVYIATLGGVFGVLPLIDFCVLLVKKNIEKYVNNKKVFMWIDDEAK